MADDNITVCQISQYNFSEFGASACTPISCYMVSKFLPVLDSNLPFVGDEVMTDSVLSGVQSLSVLATDPSLGVKDGNRHWNCEEYL